MATYEIYILDAIGAWVTNKVIERCKELPYTRDAWAHRLVMDGVTRWMIKLTTIIPLTPDEKEFIKKGLPFEVAIHEV